MARSHSSIARRANMSASNITRFFSNADFDVSGVRITTSAATDIRPPGPLALNQSVDVCGTLLSNGEVGATQIEIVPSPWDY